jgi:SPP1 family predicted phage head-tail adaptor
VIRAIDPGEFRTPLVLQSQNTTGKSTLGQPITAWTDVATIWAKVSPLSAREQWYAQQTHATTSHQVTMRYDSRVTPTCRLKMGDRIFNIDGSRNVDERNVYMIVGCTEQVPSE